METIGTHGTFGRFFRRNEKTGDSMFSLIAETGATILCRGITPVYPHHTPLYVEGDTYEEDGKQYLKTDVVYAEGYSDETSVRFLMGNDVFHTGSVAAAKIVDTSGVDIFAYVRRMKGSADRIPEIKGIDREMIQGAFNCLYDITMFDQLLRNVRRIGGSYHNAKLLYNAYRSDAENVMKANPYVLIYSGADLSLCEQLAARAEMKAYDKKRVRAVVEYAMSINAGYGNTRIEAGKLCDLVSRQETAAGGFYHTRPIFIMEEITSDHYIIEHAEDGKSYVYRRDDGEAERRISENIYRLMESSVLPKGRYDLKQVQKECGILYSGDQLAAFHVLDRSGVSIITGGPGTGKTTTLNGILHAFRQANPDGKVSLCAPTGCAARRMEACTKEKAQTIHRLLGIKPYENITAASSDKLDADLVIVDETSMVDTLIMARLISSIKNGASVIFVGDEDQLPSVGAGNVFGDMIDSGIIPVYRLSSNFRQGGRGLIIENSRKVIAGDSTLECGRSFQILRFDNEEEIVKEAGKIAECCYRSSVDFKLYTPSKQRKFRTGTIRLNRMLHAMKFPGKQLQTVSYGAYDFTVGDSVIFTKNNYEAEGGGYYNGQEGIIRDIQHHGTNVTMSVESDGRRIALTGENLADLELAYAITAHKSQGGECNNALIIIPKEPKSLLKRQLLYVEITRARKNVIILTEKDALEQAISRKGMIRRETGLCEKIRLLRIRARAA